MKRLLLSMSIVAIATGSALAADLPSRKAPPAYIPPPPSPLWTGFYVGLNAGYAFDVSSNAGTAANGWDQYYDAYRSPLWPWANNYTAGYGGLFAANSGFANANKSGFAGGGQIGYNYQWSPSLVVGLEADIQGADIRGSGSFAGVGADRYEMFGMHHGTRTTVGAGTVRAGLDWFGTVRGRLGFLFTPTLLIYGTGGLAYGGASASLAAVSSSSLVGPMIWTGGMGAQVPTSINQIAAGGGQLSDTLVGWSVGGGLEWMFMPNWSLKGEAIYYNLGSLAVTGVATAPASGVAANMGMVIADAQTIYTSTRVNYEGVVARAGVNYHFNWGSAPIVAKY
jgi:outer membrane immunogenic protein